MEKIHKRHMHGPHWELLIVAVEGWTSGQDSLDGPGSTLDHRIDDVFVSAGFSALRAEVVGDEQADRTPSGLWPSDHASTWAKIRLDNATPR